MSTRTRTFSPLVLDYKAIKKIYTHVLKHGHQLEIYIDDPITIRVSSPVLDLSTGKHFNMYQVDYEQHTP